MQNGLVLLLVSSKYILLLISWISSAMLIALVIVYTAVWFIVLFNFQGFWSFKMFFFFWLIVFIFHSILGLKSLTFFIRVRMLRRLWTICLTSLFLIHYLAVVILFDFCLTFFICILLLLFFILLIFLIRTVGWQVILNGYHPPWLSLPYIFLWLPLYLPAVSSHLILIIFHNIS